VSRVSADDRYLYFSKGSRIAGVWRLDQATGREEKLAGLERTAVRYWDVTERAVYFMERDGPDRPDSGTIKRYDLASGEVTAIASMGRADAGPGGMAVSADETTLLYVQVDQDDRDIMLVENFE